MALNIILYGLWLGETPQLLFSSLRYFNLLTSLSASIPHLLALCLFFSATNPGCSGFSLPPRTWMCGTLPFGKASAAACPFWWRFVGVGQLCSQGGKCAVPEQAPLRVLQWEHGVLQGSVRQCCVALGEWKCSEQALGSSCWDMRYKSFVQSQGMLQHLMIVSRQQTQALLKPGLGQGALCHGGLLLSWGSGPALTLICVFSQTFLNFPFGHYLGKCSSHCFLCFCCTCGANAISAW